MRIPKWSGSGKAFGVRVRLAALVLGCVLPLAVLGAFLIQDFYAVERKVLIDHTHDRVRAITAAMDREFDSTIVALQALGTSQMLANEDYKGFHGRARAALANMRADSIVVVAPDGSLLMSTRREAGEALPRLKSTPLLQRILDTGKPGVSDLFVGPLVGSHIYTIGVPIKREGRVAVTLNATANYTQLGSVLAAQNLPDNWRAAIVDRKGLVAARSHGIEKFLAKDISATLKAWIAQQREGGLESRTLDGIQVYTVFSRSAKSDWTAIVGIPFDELTGGLQRSLLWLILATVGALLAGLAMAGYIGGQIADSVQSLVEPARAIGQQMREPIPPMYFREANELGEALARAGRDLQHAREARNESEQRLALAAGAARLGIWVRDLEKGEMWTSPEWRTLFGFGAADSVGMDEFMARIHPDDRDGVLATLEEALRKVQRYETEYRIVLPDQSLLWIGSRGSVEAGAEGRARRLRGVSLDISQRRQAELEVRQKQKEVTHLGRVAVMGELSGAMAHELNQPLTAILSNAQAALRYLRQQPPRLEQVRAILDDIVFEDERASDIIQRLRRLFDKHEAPRQRIGIDALLADVSHILRNDLINHGVTLSIEAGAAGVVVEADQVQLQQVLINLLINACDAMSDQLKGVITIRTAFTDGDMVCISVIDSGSGIAAGTLEQLFSAFYSTKEQGMGLGLSICRNIAMAHGGQLWAENNLLRGATFHLSLPLAGIAA